MTSEPPLETIWDLLRARARQEPAAPCLVGPSGAVPAGEVLARADALRSRLAGRGVGPGARVILLAEGRPEAALAAMAILGLGAVLAPVPYPCRDRLGDLAGDLGADLVLASCREDLERNAPDLEGAVLLEDLPRPATPPPLPPPPGLEAPALVDFTSGTTGQPRPVLLPHRALAFCAAAYPRPVGPIRRAWSVPGSRLLDAVQVKYLAAALGAGAPFALAPRPLPRGWMARVGVARLAPASYKAVYDRRAGSWRPGLDVPAFTRLLARRALGWRVQVHLCAGAPLPEEVGLFLAACGLRLQDWYGTTETGILCAGEVGRVPPGSVGRPLPGVEIRLDGDGQVLARTPGRMERYLDSSAPEAADGFYATGDLGRLEPDGSLRITGRRRDFLALSSGLKVPAGEIERALLGDPRLRQAVVLGEGWSRAAALLVPAPGAEEDLAALLEERQATFPKALRVRHFLRLDRPLCAERGEVTTGGKACREVLARLYGPALQG